MCKARIVVNIAWSSADILKDADFRQDCKKQNKVIYLHIIAQRLLVFETNFTSPNQM